MYLSIASATGQAPAEALKPLLKALDLIDGPKLLSLYYLDDRHVFSSPSTASTNILSSPCEPSPAQACDDALRAAETLFRSIVGDDQAVLLAESAPVDD